MSVEFELKYRCPAQVQAKIRQAFPGPWEETPMATTYFDTPSGQLSRRRWTLRHRAEGGRDVCTLKTPGQGNARGEWDQECEDIFRAIPMLAAASGQSELKELTEEGLTPVCGARFTRQTTMLTDETFCAELALDLGVLMGGGKEIPLAECELELKSGDPAALEAFAEHFRQTFGLSVEPKSKFARAKALAQEE